MELETDKVNLEVPSPINGVLAEINFKDGDIVEVGALLGSISPKNTNLSGEEEIKKIEPNNDNSNVVSLEVERKEPRIFEEKKIPKPLTDEPLVLTQEIKGKKIHSEKKIVKYFLQQLEK